MAHAACLVALGNNVKGLVPIKLVIDAGFALQGEACSTRLEPAQFDPNDPIQRCLWVGARVGGAIQHTPSGLPLDTEVKTYLTSGSRAWDFCSSELFVKPRAARVITN